MGDLRRICAMAATVLLRLCLAAVLVACVQAEANESDPQVQTLSDAKTDTLVVFLDEGKKGKKDPGVAAAAKLVKKIDKSFKIKKGSVDKVAIDALANKQKEAGKNAKKFKKQGTATLKALKKSEDKIRKQILKAQGIKPGKKGKKGKKNAKKKAQKKATKAKAKKLAEKKEKKKEAKVAAKAEIQKGEEAGQASGAIAGKAAAVEAAKGYIKSLMKSGAAITATHKKEMIEAAAKAGEAAGRSSGGKKAMTASAMEAKAMVVKKMESKKVQKAEKKAAKAGLKLGKKVGTKNGSKAGHDAGLKIAKKYWADQKQKNPVVHKIGVATAKK